MFTENICFSTFTLADVANCILFCYSTCCLMHECENVHLGLYAHLGPQTSDQNNKILDTGSGNELPL